MLTVIVFTAVVSFVLGFEIGARVFERSVRKSERV